MSFVVKIQGSIFTLVSTHFFNLYPNFPIPFFMNFEPLLDIGPDSGANAQVSFSFGTNTNNVARQWEIKVTQVECWSNSRPIDSGCDQYYTGTTGRIQSYNFGQTASTSFAHLPSQR